MIDVVTVGAGGGSIAWLSPEGTLKVGPQSAGADPGPLCYAKGGQEVTITDAHVVLGRIPPHLLGGEIPLDVDAARDGVEQLAGKLGAEPGSLRHRHPRDLRLEPGQRPAPGHRQARPRRPRLHAHHLRRLGVVAAVPADGHPRHPDGAGAAEPRQRLGVRPADRRRQERLRADPRRARRTSRRGRRHGGVRRPHRAGGRGADQGGLRAVPACVRADRGPALLRAGLRGTRARARGRPRRRRAGLGGRRVPRRAPGALRLRLRRRRLPAGRVGEPAGVRDRADHAAGDPRSRGGRGSRARPRHRGSVAEVRGATSDEPRNHGPSASTRRPGTSTRRSSSAPSWPPAASRHGTGDHRGVRLDRAHPSGFRRCGSTST